MVEDKIYELMEKMYIEMQEGFKEVKTDIKDLRESQARIEFEHGEKLSALFDGYQQDSDKLDRLEITVAMHNDKLDFLEKESLKHTNQLQRIENKLEIHDAQIHLLDKTKASIK